MSQFSATDHGAASADATMNDRDRRAPGRLLTPQGEVTPDLAETLPLLLLPRDAPAVERGNLATNRHDSEDLANDRCARVAAPAARQP